MVNTKSVSNTRTPLLGDTIQLGNITYHFLLINIPRIWPDNINKRFLIGCSRGKSVILWDEALFEPLHRP